MLRGYLFCPTSSISSSRWQTCVWTLLYLTSHKNHKPAEKQSCNVAEQQRAELCHPPSSGALACQLSAVVFACQAPDESLRGKSFLWCRHVTSFKANESYVHVLRAEYFMPRRSRLREKKCQQSHRFELRSCSTRESKELWSCKTCIQMQMLSPFFLLNMCITTLPKTKDTHRKPTIFTLRAFMY